jgi:5-methylcytosine-specific restriction endonuclease McrA
VGRRGIKEYRAPEALALIAADRGHVPLVCPSCATRSIVRVPRRRGGRVLLAPERVTLTCQNCGRHASYIERGAEPPRDETMDPQHARVS